MYLRAVFWSSAPGQCGAASGMIAAGISASLQMKKRVLLLCAGSNGGLLEDVLLPGRTVKEELEGVGMKAAARGVKSGTLTEEMLQNCIVEVPGTTLSFLPGSMPKGAGREEIPELLREIAVIAERSFDLVFLKAESGNWKALEGCLSGAALMVVCLNQNRHVLSDFFDRDKGPQRNRLYIIGGYHRDSDYTLGSMKREFPKLKGKTAVLPYCGDFRDAASFGEVPRFFLRNRSAGKDEPNYDFIRQAERIAQAIAAERRRNGKFDGSDGCCGPDSAP